MSLTRLDVMIGLGARRGTKSIDAPIANSLWRLIFIVVTLAVILVTAAVFFGSKIERHIEKLNYVNDLDEARDQLIAALGEAPAQYALGPNPRALEALSHLQATLSNLKGVSPDDPLPRSALASAEAAQQHLVASSVSGELLLSHVSEVSASLALLSNSVTKWKRIVDTRKITASRQARSAEVEQRQVSSLMSQLTTAFLSTSRLHREIDTVSRFNQSTAGQAVPLNNLMVSTDGLPPVCIPGETPPAAVLCTPSSARLRVAIETLLAGEADQLSTNIGNLNWALQAYERAGERRFADLQSQLETALNAATLARDALDADTQVLGGVSRLVRTLRQASELADSIAAGDAMGVDPANHMMIGLISNIQIRVQGTMTGADVSVTETAEVNQLVQQISEAWARTYNSMVVREAAASELGASLAQLDATLSVIAQETRTGAASMVAQISSVAFISAAALAVFIVVLTWGSQVYVAQPLAKTTRAILALSRKEDVKPIRLGRQSLGLRELEEALETLRETEQQFRTAAQLTRIGRWRSEASGKLSWSPETMEICGVDPEDFTGENAFFHRMVPPEDREHLAAARKKAYADGEPFQAVHRLIRPDGKVLTVFERAELLRDNDGAHIGLAGVIQDITETVEMEQRLQQSQKLEVVGQLTGGVAHDFNNLLAVILGSLELLQISNDPEKNAEYLDAAITATERGADLTHKLLTFARQSKLEPKVLDLNDLVRETEAWSGRVLPANIDVRLQKNPSLWSVQTDPGLAQNALLNLIVNARDAMPNGGRLVISLTNAELSKNDLARLGEDIAPGRYVALTVRDTGVGIPKADLENVFAPFFTTKPPGSGSGLGLSMIQGFMKQSGGAVHVASEPDQGTNFTLYFPAFETSSAQAPDGSAQAFYASRDTARILLVEDEPRVRHVLTDMLAQQGHAVHPAASGDDAFELWLKDSTFDLLITDVVMPGHIQGPALVELIRETTPDLPVMLISGYSRDEARALQSPPFNVVQLTKPVSRVDFIAAVSKLLIETSALNLPETDLPKAAQI